MRIPDKYLRYDYAGLTDVVFANTDGLIYENTKDYGESIAYRETEALQREVALALCLRHNALGAAEFCFVRYAMELSRPQLGRTIGRGDQIIKKWEEGHTPIPLMASRALKQEFLSYAGHQDWLAETLAQPEATGTAHCRIELRFDKNTNRWSSNLTSPRLKVRVSNLSINDRILSSAHTRKAKGPEMRIYGVRLSTGVPESPILGIISAPTKISVVTGAKTQLGSDRRASHMLLVAAHAESKEDRYEEGYLRL
jgi:DNA-binding transcriptional regulator YiaG